MPGSFASIVTPTQPGSLLSLGRGCREASAPKSFLCCVCLLLGRCKRPVKSCIFSVQQSFIAPVPSTHSTHFLSPYMSRKRRLSRRRGGKSLQLYLCTAIRPTDACKHTIHFTYNTHKKEGTEGNEKLNYKRMKAVLQHCIRTSKCQQAFVKKKMVDD